LRTPEAQRREPSAQTPIARDHRGVGVVVCAQQRAFPQRQAGLARGNSVLAGIFSTRMEMAMEIPAERGGGRPGSRLSVERPTAQAAIVIRAKR
jgi:hypothetical protein